MNRVNCIDSQDNEENKLRYLVERQCNHLRVDTHTDNKVMQNLLAKLGFKKKGKDAAKLGFAASFILHSEASRFC